MIQSIEGVKKIEKVRTKSNTQVLINMSGNFWTNTSNEIIPTFNLIRNTDTGVNEVLHFSDDLDE